MSREKADDWEPKKTIGVQVKESQYHEVKARADSMNMTMAMYIKTIVFNHINSSSKLSIVED